MIKTYVESISRREANIPRTDLLRVAVENNTLQVAQLMETLRSTIPDNTLAIKTLPVSPPSPTHGRPLDVPHDPISQTPAQDTVNPPDINEDLPIEVFAPPTNPLPLAPDLLPVTETIITDAHTTQAGICMDCAVPGGSLLLCEDCHLYFHEGCLTEEVQLSDLLCRVCTEKRHRLAVMDEDTLRSPSSTESNSAMSTSSEDDLPGRITRSTKSKGPTLPSQRLSPRGLPNRLTRTPRIAQPSPSYSQSTLSFSSKRKSSHINPDNAGTSTD
jgi:hypothetical protein